MKNVVVKTAEVSTPHNGLKRGQRFLVWRVINESGIGVEETHFTNELGDGPLPEIPKHFKILDNGWEHRVMPAPVPS